MARPAKTLASRVRERKFKAREHHALLAGPLVGPPQLRAIQERYQHADSDTVRRALALEYQRLLVSGAAAEVDAPPPDVSLPVARFFPAMFAHVKGPAAGQPFRLRAVAAALRGGVHAGERRGRA